LDVAVLPAGIKGGDLVALNSEPLLLFRERSVLLGDAPGEVLARRRSGLGHCRALVSQQLHVS
jgi:hypothetical protein